MSSTIAKTDNESRPADNRLIFQIRGMTCASCVGRVEKAIAAAPGVQSVQVNLATEKADVTFTAEPDTDAVVQAISGAGYQVGTETIELTVTGMSCASCVGRIENALKSWPGVTDATVNLATGRASVQVIRGTVTASDLENAVARTGYTAKRIAADQADQDDATKKQEITGLKRDLVLSAILTLPVVILSMGDLFIPSLQTLIDNSIGQQGNWIIQFFLTSAILIGPGRRFYKKGIPALLRRAPDMNSLVALGTGAAWSYSTVTVFLPGLLPEGTRHVYFEAAAVIASLILLGRFLEARAKGQTGAAIRRLMDLRAKTARIIRDGDHIELPIDEVRIGDLILVRPGEKIAVDGEVTEGSTFIDESMITGEPVPAPKGTGDRITGGTINKSGTLTFRATEVGSDTVLARIIQMVERAQGAKLPIQALVDKVTAWFVPAVMALAVLTFLAWIILGPAPALSFALVSAVAVLIIACPCAMGLATPTSIMVGIGRGAEMGVLFRNGEALQTLHHASVIALDKTGTLTKGKPELTDLTTAEGYERSWLLALIASVESRSEHPIARSIVEAATAEGLSPATPEGFAAVPGFGVRAQVDGHDVAIGADRFMQRLGLDIGPFATTAEQFGRDGKSPLYAAIDGKLAAILAVADPIKETTSQAIETLHNLGLKVAMITGDNCRTAEAIGKQLGIDRIVAEVLPDGKVQALQRLKSGGGKLAFVGDGINDAPALAEADIGIAIGTGTDVAIESADVVLMSGELTGVPNALALSRAAMRNIRQNLFWAFAYNAALIPVAAGVFYPLSGMTLSPMLAAGAMAFSSIFVIGNALRLKRFRPAGHGETHLHPSPAAQPAE